MPSWSATRQPVNGDRGEASAAFSADRAEFRRVLLGIETVMSVSVSADDDVEVRRLTVTQPVAPPAVSGNHFLCGTGAGAAGAPMPHTRRSARCSSKPSADEEAC